MKVAIIGAGPAGLSSAIFLSKEGVDVTLYEAFNVGQNIVCAEGFFDFHESTDINLPEGMKIKKIIVKDKEEISVSLPNSSKLFTFDRTKWQISLMNDAKAKGTKVVENKKILKNEILALSEKNDYVIDATGIKAVSHFLFPKRQVNKYRKYLVPTFQYVLKGDFSEFEGVIKTIVLNNPAGYYWFFPKLLDGNIAMANVGLGFLAKNKNMPNLKVLLEEIIKKENIVNYQIVSKKGSTIPTKRIKTYRHKNVILTGDALGLCSPLHGGGIDSAYLSGFYVAKSIINNDFKIYEHFLNALDKRFFKERLIVYLWNLIGSEKVLSRLKNKGLFEDNKDNVVFTNNWLKKALFKLFI